MIFIENENRIFYLNGDRYSYILYVNEAGFLQLLHYGAKISPDNTFLKTYGETVAPNASDWNYDMTFDCMPSECAFFGHGDFREPTVLIERTDGGLVSRFRYLSHRVYDGVPAVEGMPHARRGGKTLEITLGDDFSSARIVLHYTVFPEVLVRNAEIVNAGEETFKLKRAFSFCTELPDNNFSLMRLHGTWGAERTPETVPLGHGIVRLQSLRGTSSHQMNPFMGLLRNHCTEENGECYGFQLIYSGSYALTAEVNSMESVRLQGGINDLSFGWALAGGEKFVTPQAVLCYSDCGMGALSRSYADFLREYVINPDYVYRRRPVVVNNWEATYMDFNLEKLSAIIDEAAKIGADTFVLDDGWFGKRDDDRTSLGDWFVNEKKLQGGLDAVIDCCKRNGLKFGLWFEPEMVSEDSELYRAHPDWTIHKEGVELCRSRNQLVLDFSRPEVVDDIFNAVSEILSRYDIDYVKWDMNRNITENYTASLPEDRQGELWHRYILGVYSLAERLTGAFPKVFFEGCASGGARYDSGMLYYFPQIWTSDNTDAFERAKIQWGTSICYPLSSMSCHVSVCPNHQTHRSTPFSTRGAVASLGAMGYELDPSKMSEEEKACAKLQIEAYRTIDELILKGDLYRLQNPFEDGLFCMMVVSKDKTRAYVVAERLRGYPVQKNRLLRLYGLDEKKRYRIRELGLTACGDTLCRLGAAVPYLEEYGSFVWNIKEV